MKTSQRDDDEATEGDKVSRRYCLVIDGARLRCRPGLGEGRRRLSRKTLVTFNDTDASLPLSQARPIQALGRRWSGQIEVWNG